MIDISTEIGANAVRRLNEEQIIWLTTVRPDGMPQPTPVWFLWDGETILIYSQPNAKKVRNLTQNPKVALNLNSDAQGGDVLIIFGRAQIDPEALLANLNPAYLEKYRQGITNIDMTPESMSKEYSTVIRITPERVRSF
jgi:PPOX class probable F420-dependent enzyme